MTSFIKRGKYVIVLQTNFVGKERYKYKNSSNSTVINNNSKNGEHVAQCFALTVRIHDDVIDCHL